MICAKWLRKKSIAVNSQVSCLEVATPKETQPVHPFSFRRFTITFYEEINFVKLVSVWNRVLFSFLTNIKYVNYVIR